MGKAVLWILCRSIITITASSLLDSLVLGPIRLLQLRTLYQLVNGMLRAGMVSEEIFLNVSIAPDRSVLNPIFRILSLGLRYHLLKTELAKFDDHKK